MSVRGDRPALRDRLERGQYVVDSRAVAEAMLRSWMLVAAQARNGPVPAEKSQPATG